MQVTNNYKKDIFNGDIGRIISIDKENQEVIINFDGKHTTYEYNDLDELVLSYAVTVHKSQGSEYNAVVVPVMTQHYILLQRNLIYTAVTRGKKLVVMVGTKKALAIGVKNNKTENKMDDGDLSSALLFFLTCWWNILENVSGGCVCTNVSGCAQKSILPSFK